MYRSQSDALAASWRADGGRPLAGYGVAVTRDEESDGPLSRCLRTRGARVFLWPSVTVGPPRDPAPFDDAVRRLTDYDWIVFSSRHAVTALIDRVTTCPNGLRVAVVGSATAEALLAAGWPIHVIPAAFNAAALVREMAQHHQLEATRVLFPSSSISQETIRSELRRIGAQVDQVTAYETHGASLDRQACLDASRSGELHAITFASGSAVSGFHKALGDTGCAEVLARLAPVTIGTTTANALAEQCHVRATVARQSTFDGLADAVVVALQAGSA